MPDMIRHLVSFWIPAPFLRRGRHTGMTTVTYLIAGEIKAKLFSFKINRITIYFKGKVLVYRFEMQGPGRWR